MRCLKTWPFYIALCWGLCLGLVAGYHPRADAQVTSRCPPAGCRIVNATLVNPTIIGGSGGGGGFDGGSLLVGGDLFVDGGTTLNNGVVVNGPELVNGPFEAHGVVSSYASHGGVTMGSVSANNGLWMLPGAGVPDLTNYSLLDASGTILNAKTGTTDQLRVNNATILTASATAVTSTQQIIAPSGVFNGAPTDTSTALKVGVVSGFAGIWASNVLPDTTNYAFLQVGLTSAFNAPSGGSLRFRIAGAEQIICNAITGCVFTFKQTWPTGAAGSSGRTALVAGTATVSTTAVTAASVIQLTNCVPSGTLGLPSVGTLTAGTSFVINSEVAASVPTLNNLDTSTICWSFVN